LEKEGNMGGFGLNSLHLPPWLAAGQRQGWLGRRRPAGLSTTAAASERGKGLRATGEFTSLTHLGLGRTVEAARGRRRTGGAGLAVAARYGRAARQWRGWGGLVVRRGRGRAIYSRSEVGSGKIFVHTGAPARSTPASSSSFARRRPVTRWLGQRRQVNSCRRGDGSACAAVGRGRRPAVAAGA
jgi:hypothetical protein